MKPTIPDLKSKLKFHPLVVGSESAIFWNFMFKRYTGIPDRLLLQNTLSVASDRMRNGVCIPGRIPLHPAVGALCKDSHQTCKGDRLHRCLLISPEDVKQQWRNSTYKQRLVLRNQ